MDDDTAEQLRNLMAKGFAGTVLLTSDVQASYEFLTARRRIRRTDRSAPLRHRLRLP